jgi:hypothetical protein
MGNAGGPLTPLPGLITYPAHKAALHTARAKLKMAKESKPVIKNTTDVGGTVDLVKERGGGQFEIKMNSN